MFRKVKSIYFELRDQLPEESSTGRSCLIILKDLLIPMRKILVIPIMV